MRCKLKRCAASIAAVLLIAAFGGCADPDDSPVPKAEPGPLLPHPQRPGDPAIGKSIVVDGDYVSCGIPYRAWEKASGVAADARRLPGRAQRNEHLPYYLSTHENDQGVAIVTTNCLLCHGGTFDGAIVIGLGNETLDFTTDPMTQAVAAGSYVSGDAETAAWRKWLQRVSAIAPYMITDTVGVNPAPNLTLALIAHRDAETLEWSETPTMAPPRRNPLPVSVPPWWRMQKKHAMFYNAMGRGDHARFMMMKSLVCTDSLAEARPIDEMFTHVRAYLASLEPPAYPYAIDAALAGQGRAVFEAHCSHCHGTYGPDGEYPNLLVALEVVGTDPAYARQSFEDADRFMRWFNRSWYGEIASAVPAAGYVAPPLDAIWATAPFLHNGSVPTIEALLDSRKRPTYWTRRLDAGDFDRDAVGLSFDARSHGKQDAENPGQRALIYDTTLPGYSNGGHTFGDALTPDERAAVVEYLKTL